MTPERGQATIGYLGTITLVAAGLVTTIAAAGTFAPAIGEMVGCQIVRAVETVSGTSPRECTGPSSSGTTPSGQTPTIPVTATVISGTVDAGTGEVLIQLQGPPGTSCTVSSDSPWLAVNPTSESGPCSRVVRVTAHANPGENRTGTVDVTTPDGITIQVPIDQPGGQQRYVALGDSYSAGPAGWFDYDSSEIEPTGFGPSFPSYNSDDCSRAATAWPRLLGNGKQTTAGTPNLHMETDDFAACSGATTDGQDGSPSLQDQIDSNQQRLADADILTLSIGGNNIGFGQIVKTCLTPWKSADDCADAINNGRTRIEEDLPAELEAAYTAALQAAPNATIYIVGYPAVVESDDQAGGFLQIDQANVKGAADLISKLNQASRKTVAKVLAEHPEYGSRLVYIDPTGPDSPFTGHSVYDDDPYFHPPTVPVIQSFHPNESGHQTYADLVGRAMLGNP